MFFGKQVFVFVINFLLIKAETKKNETEKWGKSYHFIIVGGGTAGAVLASRLSELKKWKILLLEAGEQPSLLSNIPSMARSVQLLSSNWAYLSERQNNTFKGLHHNRILWSSGKVLGGSSAINYMIYERGNPQDYDHWKETGNDGWSFEDVQPYFLKSEKSNLEHVDGNYHGKLGPMSIEYSYSGENSIEFLKAAKEMGYNTIDYNGKNQIGFSALQATLKDGSRQTTAKAFLQPVLNRTNLEVVLLAEVNKIIMNSSRKKAKAVKFTKGNKTYKAYASKEVIVSAGAFNSPKLLMLSGIGPEDVLKKAQIRPIKVLPVGHSLRDHVTYPGLSFITNHTRNKLEVLKNYIIDIPNWYITGKGTFSSLANFEAVGFVKVNSNRARPDVELLFLDSGPSSLVQRVANIEDAVYEKLYENVKNLISWSIYPTLLHPKSKGRILLRSKKPSDPPLLHPNYFSDKEDLKPMIEAIRFVLKMVETSEFRQVNASLNPNQVPGCNELQNGSDEYWECALRTLATTSNDQFGSCKMGPVDDPEAVVDDKLRVHGIDNLRVVDASIIPVTISGRLLAATVMVAERAGDFIKEAYK